MTKTTVKGNSKATKGAEAAGTTKITKLTKLIKGNLGPADRSVERHPEDPRRLKRQKYRSFRLHKRIKPATPPLKGSVEIFLSSWKLIGNNKRLFLGLTLTYFILSMILVRGLSSNVDIRETKNVMSEFFQGEGWSGAAINASLFGLLIGSVGNTASAEGAVYQMILLIAVSLATVWALRQVSLKKRVFAKEAFYKGMTPVIVVICVLGIISLQLLPLGAGAWLYTALVTGGVLVTSLEKTIATIFCIMLALLTLYMISSSLFGLFVATLPNMTPMRALRGARNLVLHRRWKVALRIIMLIVALPILSALIMIPVIIWLPIVAEWLFFAMTMFGTIFSVTYLYLLYRELLHED